MLVLNGVVELNDSSITTEYINFQWGGCINACFIGQIDSNKKPNGLVRAISCNNDVYEGLMTSNGSREGWG